MMKPDSGLHPRFLTRRDAQRDLALVSGVVGTGPPVLRDLPRGENEAALMARGEDGLSRVIIECGDDDVHDNVVYDSQEELDQWPDSQPATSEEPEPKWGDVNQTTLPGKRLVA